MPAEPMQNVRRLLAMALLGSGSLAACLSPMLDGISATAVGRDTMVRAANANVQLYYPTAQADAAANVGGHLQACLQQLDTQLQSPQTPVAPQVILHNGELNNAYVSPLGAGLPQFMVLPMHEGLEMFNLLNLGLVEIGEVSCHEAVHYRTFQQIFGFWDGVNRVFGDVLSPMVFVDAWFHEGMATYYEARLSPSFGRPSSALWRGMFEAAVASRRGHLQAGDLSPAQREISQFGGHYLVGLHFVEYLIDHYGAAKLWQFIDQQAHSVFSPFGITLRFAQVYGKSLEALFDAWQEELQQRAVAARPPASVEQQLAPSVGTWARLAACPANNLLAYVHDGPDVVPRLSVLQQQPHSQTWQPLWSLRLTDILPPRQSIAPRALQISGLSFRADCQALYFTSADVDRDAMYATAIYRVDVAQAAITGRWEGIYGVGGSVDPSGNFYTYVQLQQQHASLQQRDLRNNTDTQPYAPIPNTTSLGAPAVSPTGAQLAVAARTPQGFNLFVYEAHGKLQQLTQDAQQNYSPHWLNEQQLLFVRGAPPQHLQAWLYDLRDHSMQQVSHTRFALLDPVGLPQGIAYLAAEGWGWEVASSPLPRRQAVPPNPSSLASVTSTSVAAAPPAATFSPPQSTQLFAKAAAWQDLHVSLHAPYFLLLPSGDALSPIFGAALQLEDRLGYHIVALNGQYQNLSNSLNVSLGYLNSTQAPWLLSAQAAYSFAGNYQTLGFGVQASRPLWSSSVALSLAGFDARHNPTLPHSAVPSLRLIGPGVSLQYDASETTPYAGAVRALRLGSSVQGYPKFFLADTAGLLDVRLAASGVVPLPGSARHTLSLGLRARQLFGTRIAALQIGNIAAGNVLWSGLTAAPAHFVTTDAKRQARGSPSQTLNFFRGNLGLSEAQRGYEDSFWQTRRTALLDVDYLYPLIIDHGWHSFFYIFPSLFVQQINLELWASASLQTPQQLYRAFGTTLSLFTLWGRTAAGSLLYQYAYRVDLPSQPSEHLVLLNF